MNFTNSLQLFVASALLLLASGLAAESVITYQGQLQSNTGPVTDMVDMSFSLWSAESGGSEISSISVSQVNVVDGLFQVELDFGTAAFDDGPRFLEVNIEGSTLSPRQRIAAVPVAIRALSGQDPLWDDSNGNLLYNGGNVTVGSPRLITRFGVNAASGETVMLARSSGLTALRVNDNRSVSVGANYASNGIPDRGLRVWGESIFDSDVEMQGRLDVQGALDVLGNVSFDGRTTVGSLASPQRLGVGTDNPWNTLHVISPAGEGPLRVMIENNTTTSAVLRGYSNQGVAIGHSYADADVPSRGLIVRGEIHVRDLEFVGSDPASNVCPQAVNGGPVWRLVRCSPNSSSARLKDDIEPLHGTADMVRALRPVQYTWIDSGRADIGLIAEEVDEVIPDIVIRDSDGQIEGFNYNRLGALLIGAFQEMGREQDQRMAQLKADNEALKGRLERAEVALTSVEEVTRRNAELERRLLALEGLLIEHRELSNRTP